MRKDFENNLSAFAVSAGFASVSLKSFELVYSGSRSPISVLTDTPRDRGTISISARLRGGFTLETTGRDVSRTRSTAVTSFFASSSTADVDRLAVLPGHIPEQLLLQSHQVEVYQPLIKLFVYRLREIFEGGEAKKHATEHNASVLRGGIADHFEDFLGPFANHPFAKDH